MTTTNTVRLASVRVITRDVPRAVAFYEVLTGATPNYLTEDFVELVTPSATVAITDASRVPAVADDIPGAAAGDRSIVEFLVDDAEALLTTMKATYDDELDVVQAPTVMPCGNVSILIRDPDGLMINLYTPVTPGGWQLQQNRTPKLGPPTR